jgi:hypothetical protein
MVSAQWEEALSPLSSNPDINYLVSGKGATALPGKVRAAGETTRRPERGMCPPRPRPLPLQAVTAVAAPISHIYVT